MRDPTPTDSALPDEVVEFGACRLNRLAQRLERNGEPVHLEPKAWQLLSFLLERPGRVVPKDELLAELWPGLAVADGSLTRVVAVLRGALGDSARNPEYIETVHRRGFRFVATVSATTPPAPSPEPQFTPKVSGNERFVGRADPLSRLRRAFAKASGGERQVVFVEGEAGIGKTSLIDEFLEALPADHRRVAGRCIEHHATAEPYHPILDAIEKLAQAEGDVVIDVLRVRAPHWLAQMPWLTGETPIPASADPSAGASGPRMLRELPRALEAITTDSPLVLVIEDLHWSDPATIDLVQAIASRDETARLLLIASYRGAHAIAHASPVVSVVHSLRRNRQCDLLSLEPLGREDIEAYLSHRFHSDALTSALAEPLQERTDGNPLFLTTMVDHLIDASWILKSSTGWDLGRSIDDLASSDVPADLRMTIELQFALLDPDARMILDAASVMGERFAVEAVAAALDRDAVELEPTLEALSQNWQMIRRSDGLLRWPDGTAVSHYQFRHALYRSVLYEKIAPLRRREIHQKIGERIESAFAGKTSRVCAEIAGHFERSGDALRCAVYSLEAANQARWRFANQEAQAFFTAAVAAVDLLGQEPTRLSLEVLARMGLALTRLMRQDDTTAADEENLARIEGLCRRIEDETQRFRALEALFRIQTLRRRTDLAAPIAEEMYTIAGQLDDPRRSVVAYFARGSAQLNLGHFETAMETTDAAQEIHRAGLPLRFAGRRRHQLKWADDGLWLSTARQGPLIFLGRLDEALRQVETTVRMASGEVPPLSAATALLGSSVIAFQLGKLELADRLAQQGLGLATGEEIIGMQAAFEVSIWCIALRSGNIRPDDPQVLEPLRGVWDDSLRDKFSTPYPIGPVFYLEGCLQAGAPTEGLRVLNELLSQTRATQTVWFESDLLRLQGELLVLEGAENATTRAQACFREAHALAKKQTARFCELRASLALAKLRCEPQETSLARISKVYRFFENQPDIGAPDVIEARNLLARGLSS